MELRNLFEALNHSDDEDIEETWNKIKGIYLENAENILGLEKQRKRVGYQKKAKVQINNELSETLIVNIGVKQGDLLSALLFSVIMDQVLKSLDIRGNISTRLR
jgi:hypothetical protein